MTSILDDDTYPRQMFDKALAAWVSAQAGMHKPDKDDGTLKTDADINEDLEAFRRETLNVVVTRAMKHDQIAEKFAILEHLYCKEISAGPLFDNTMALMFASVKADLLHLDH